MGQIFHTILPKVEPVELRNDPSHPDIRRYERPSFDTFTNEAADRGEVGIRIGRDMADFAKVIMLRSTVNIGEWDYPYEEEFDGNDLCATHLIGYVGHEPAGCMRVRYFAGFAKIERLVMRRNARGKNLAALIVQAGVDLCRSKGYRFVYMQAREELFKFWNKMGFKVLTERGPVRYGDYDHYELLKEVEPTADAISMESHPYVIIRTEGKWHEASPHEISATRSSTS